MSPYCFSVGLAVFGLWSFENYICNRAISDTWTTGTETERIGLYYRWAAAHRPLYRTATKADNDGRLRNKLVSVDILW